MKDKIFRQSRDVTVILGDSLVKNGKGWELTDRSDKFCCKIIPWSYHQSNEVACVTSYGTKSQIYHFTFYIDSEPQNIAEELLELAKSIRTDCNNNVTVSCILPRYGKLNEKVRSVNRLSRIYCKNMDIRFVGHENINPSKHLNRSGLHINHLGHQF